MLIIVRNKKMKELYHRIVFGLSTMDLIMTIATITMPYTIRSDIGLLFAVGNVRTCEAAGFLWQTWLGSTIYNSVLSVYFLFTVQYGWREQQMSKKMEPWCHILAIVIPLIFAIAGLAIQGFNPVPYTFAEALGLIHLGVLGIAAIIGIGSTFRVYWSVRQQTLRNQLYAASGAPSESQLNRIKAVRNQALCYTAAFLVSLSSAFFALYDDPTVVWPLVILYILFPLQGFWNWMIYTRPRLVRWKDAHPDNSWFWAYRQVLSGKPAPTTRRTRHLRGTNKPRNSTQASSVPLSMAQSERVESTHTTPQGGQVVAVSEREPVPGDEGSSHSGPQDGTAVAPRAHESKTASSDPFESPPGDESESTCSFAQDLPDREESPETTEKGDRLSWPLLNTVRNQVAKIREGLSEEEVRCTTPLMAEKSDDEDETSRNPLDPLDPQDSPPKREHKSWPSAPREEQWPVGTSMYLFRESQTNIGAPPRREDLFHTSLISCPPADDDESSCPLDLTDRGGDDIDFSPRLGHKSWHAASGDGQREWPAATAFSSSSNHETQRIAPTQDNKYSGIASSPVQERLS
ncbi:unknown protein [Seminavis robusta]|uniref:Uncharacterized protein n=1 Tax=Seminavis robusta TaxID=568900 RepID=A0A9N8HN35_9STRA|nr:unknown protein [Seminavis robusta]|eukprot:Sro1050_g235610.1 n/a (574) ;mRNA; f:35549-37341